MNKLTDLQRDILIKSREGIQHGMWCRGDAFLGETIEFTSVDEMWTWRTPDVLSELSTETHRELLDQLDAAHRCATGEIYLQALKLGGTVEDTKAVFEVVGRIVAGEAHGTGIEHEDNEYTAQNVIEGHNDNCTTIDPTQAGESWASIFDKALIADELL